MRFNHKPARGKPSGGNLITKAQEHKRTNLEIARAVLDDPAKHDLLTLEWARLVVGKAEAV